MALLSGSLEMRLVAEVEPLNSAPWVLDRNIGPDKVIDQKAILPHHFRRSSPARFSVVSTVAFETPTSLATQRALLPCS